MDEPKKTEDTQAKQPKPPVVNDIMPPPDAELVTDESDQESVEVEVKTDQAPRDALVQEDSGDIDHAPLATPPNEESVVDKSESSTDDTSSPLSSEQAKIMAEPEDKINPSANTMDSEPVAVVGVAASQMQKAQHPHRNNKRLAVIVTVVAALLLAGMAVYVYLNTGNNAQETSDKTVQSPSSQELASSPTDVSPATINDLESLTNEIDTVVNELDDTNAFNSTDLSDDTLGL